MSHKVTLLLLAWLLIADCRRLKVQRVVVAYPSLWSGGEYRNCALHRAGLDVIHSDLPVLDCDLLLSGQPTNTTPRDRTFVMDVSFSGSYSPATVAVSDWTCQRLDEKLVCGQ